MDASDLAARPLEPRDVGMRGPRARPLGRFDTAVYAAGRFQCCMAVRFSVQAALRTQRGGGLRDAYQHGGGATQTRCAVTAAAHSVRGTGSALMTGVLKGEWQEWRVGWPGAA